MLIHLYWSLYRLEIVKIGEFAKGSRQMLCVELFNDQQLAHSILGQVCVEIYDVGVLVQFLQFHLLIFLVDTSDTRRRPPMWVQCFRHSFVTYFFGTTFYHPRCIFQCRIK